MLRPSVHMLSLMMPNINICYAPPLAKSTTARMVLQVIKLDIFHPQSSATLLFTSSSAVSQPCLDPQSTLLPGIGWCGAGLPPSPTACWWLTHPAAITGVSVSAGWDSPGGCGGPSVLLVCNRRVHDASSLQARYCA